MDLKQRIHDSGLSYRQLADRSGVSLSWIEKYMSGRIQNPGIKTVARVEAAIKHTRRRKSN